VLSASVEFYPFFGKARKFLVQEVLIGQLALHCIESHRDASYRSSVFVLVYCRDVGEHPIGCTCVSGPLVVSAVGISIGCWDSIIDSRYWIDDGALKVRHVRAAAIVIDVDGVTPCCP
jgi:hypothetical protein